jgi:hypothetical protein
MSNTTSLWTSPRTAGSSRSPEVIVPERNPVWKYQAGLAPPVVLVGFLIPVLISTFGPKWVV